MAVDSHAAANLLAFIGLAIGTITGTSTADWSALTALATVGLALITAVVASIAAWGIKTATNDATKTFKLTQTLAQASFALELIKDYGQPAMLGSIRALQLWQQKHGDKFAPKFATARQAHPLDPEIVKLDEQRRMISFYFEKVANSIHLEALGESQARAMLGSQIWLAFDYSEPIEKALVVSRNEPWTDKTFEKLHDLFPDYKKGSSYLPTIKPWWCRLCQSI